MAIRQCRPNNKSESGPLNKEYETRPSFPKNLAAVLSVSKESSNGIEERIFGIFRDRRIWLDIVNCFKPTLKLLFCPKRPSPDHDR